MLVQRLYLAGSRSLTYLTLRKSKQQNNEVDFSKDLNKEKFYLGAKKLNS